MIASSRRSTANHEKASRGLKSSRSSVKASISFGQQPASLPIREKKGFGRRPGCIDGVASLRTTNASSGLVEGAHVAAYFAVCDYDEEDGELWTFDEPLYEQQGKQQWKNWPNTTVDGSGSDDKFMAALTAFTREEPPDWFICGFYFPGFPRQNAQDGVYTITAQFGRDHAQAIAHLLGDDSHYRLYVISETLKAPLLKLLRERHGIWRGSLFPDAAGAAKTANTVFDGTSAL